jgi:hypothetical protein
VYVPGSLDTLLPDQRGIPIRRAAPAETTPGWARRTDHVDSAIMSETGAPPVSKLTRTIVFLGVVLATWLSSLCFYDAEKMRDAARDRQAALSGATPFQWSFSNRHDIDGGHGVRRFAWDGETVTARGDGLYFYLNMQGRAVDARRYSTIRIRMHSEQAGHLRLYHHQLDDDFIHAARPVPVRVGWQTLVLDLGGTDWFMKDLLHPDTPDSPSSWGGADGVVTALRLDPVASGGFVVDHVELPPGPGASYAPAIVTFENLDDEIFTQMRSDGNHDRILARDSWLRTPESSAWQRRQIAREFPAAIVFPRPPSPAGLEAGFPDEAPPPGLWVALVAALASILGRRAGSSWTPAAEVLALVLLIEAGVYWYPELAPTLRAAAIGLLALVLWWLKPTRPLSGVTGSPRAWLLLAPLVIIPLGLLLYFGGQDMDPARLIRMLMVYYPWALFQQYLVAMIVFRRLQLLHPGVAVMLAAAVFAVLHLPNFGLMIATFLLGNLWLWIFRRHGNLLAIATSHAVLALCADELLPSFLLLSRNVGVAYLANL